MDTSTRVDPAYTDYLIHAAIESMAAAITQAVYARRGGVMAADPDQVTAAKNACSRAREAADNLREVADIAEADWQARVAKGLERIAAARVGHTAPSRDIDEA